MSSLVRSVPRHSTNEEHLGKDGHLLIVVYSEQELRQLIYIIED